jgi:hypothetical protein
MEIYLLIKKFEPAPEPENLNTYTPESVELEFSGTGIGNKSIAAISEKLGLELRTAIDRLKLAGIIVEEGQTMKAVAEVTGTEAIEIMKVMLIDGYKPLIKE